MKNNDYYDIVLLRLLLTVKIQHIDYFQRKYHGYNKRNIFS